MRRRRAGQVLALLLAVLGTWQLGAGGYIHAKAWLAQRLLERAWSEARAGAGHVKPWPWADTWPVARLRFPRRHVDLIVLAGATGRTLAFAPGHLSGTPLPGQAGDSVISGHRDTHFRFLQYVKVGEPIEVESTDGSVKRFRVTATRVVNGTNARLAAGGNTPMLTLVTCYPFDAIVPGGPLRYLVTARAVIR
ncbi:MAG: class GN sortase [Gammaproteobacteria bacterium]